MSRLLVFQTDINTDKRVHRAACRLCKLKGICRWSLDVDDCVLRIETNSLTETEIIQLLTRAGFQCTSLTQSN